VSRPALGPTQIEMVPGAFSPGIKRPGGEADHSPLPSAEIKSARSYTSTSPYVFMAKCRKRDSLEWSTVITFSVSLSKVSTANLYSSLQQILG